MDVRTLENKLSLHHNPSGLEMESCESVSIPENYHWQIKRYVKGANRQSLKNILHYTEALDLSCTPICPNSQQVIVLPTNFTINTFAVL